MALMRLGRSAKRCAARKLISTRSSSGPPVSRKLATWHDSRRLLTDKVSSASCCALSWRATRSPSTHAFSAERFGSVELGERGNIVRNAKGFEPPITADVVLPDDGTETSAIK